mgnify:FL=1
MSKIIKAGTSAPRMPRYLVYGRSKQGKTTFACTAPNVLVLDPESGTREGASQVDVYPVERWQDCDEALKFLRGSAHGYDWIVVDGLTRINQMSLKHVMRLGEEADLSRVPGMVQLKDYGRAGELMKGLLLSLHTLPGVGIVYTAQDRMEAPDMSDDDLLDEDAQIPGARYVPDLPRSVRGAATAMVDCIGRVYSVSVTGPHPKTGREITQRQHRLWIGQAEQYDTGYRSPHRGIPDYLRKPSVPRLQELLETGKTN